MNRVVLVGRLTKDPELRKTKDDISVVKFTMAIARKGDKDKADYINCNAWRGLADTISKYVKKGQKLALEGRIETNSYDAQDGTKRYTTEIQVDNITFVGSSNQPSPTSTNFGGNESIDFEEIPLTSEDLPF